MKKLILVLSAILLIGTINNSYAQKAFEGTITYGIEYEDLPEEMEAMRAMLPTETTIKIKDSKTRTEQSMGMGSTISIFDGKTNSSITLMDMMGQKIAIPTSSEELEKEESKNEGEVLDIEYFDETKEIAGYTCKKASIKVKGTDERIIVYYTEEINTQQTRSQYKGLKGFPMTYEINTPEMSMIMTVTSVKKEKISSSEFEIPEGYEEMSMEDFQKKMSGGMMGE